VLVHFTFFFFNEIGKVALVVLIVAFLLFLGFILSLQGVDRQYPREKITREESISEKEFDSKAKN